MKPATVLEKLKRTRQSLFLKDHFKVLSIHPDIVVCFENQNVSKNIKFPVNTCVGKSVILKDIEEIKAEGELVSSWGL